MIHYKGKITPNYSKILPELRQNNNRPNLKTKMMQHALAQSTMPLTEQMAKG